MRTVFSWFALLGLFLTGASQAQNTCTLQGVVYDEFEQALTGATVLLDNGKNAAVTDKEGLFVFENLTPGTHALDVHFIGFKAFTCPLHIEKDTSLQIILVTAYQSLQEVVVTDSYAESRKKEEALNIEIVNDNYLKQNLGGSLMQSLERLPGLSTIDIGSGQSKPVIRGLSFNRVVVVENNIKHEGQQWGADHGLEIDQYAVNNIEIIKGPASLMYGSDAIGGVIDMKNRKLPAENSIGGSVNFTGKTNNNFLGTSVSLHGRKKRLFAELRATVLDYGDYRVPTDSIDIYSYRAALHNNFLRNTAGEEQDLHVTFGYIDTRFQSRFYISNIASKSGFFANAHGLEPRRVDTDLHDKSSRDIQYPYQTADHFKVINVSRWTGDKVELQTDLGFQRNYREEWSQYVSHGYMPAVFPDSIAFNPDLEREFEKNVYSGNVKFEYRFGESTQVNAGVSGELQENSIDGRGFIIPAFKQTKAGTFVLFKHAFSGNNRVSAGVRFDYGKIRTQAYYDWFPSPVISNGDTSLQFLQRAENTKRSFSNLTWSAGYSYNNDKWLGKINIGKSFRLPTAKELAANGVNYHHFSYEVGDKDLSPDVSYQLDAGLEYTSKKFAIGTNPFVNYFPNYIYLNPSSLHDRLYGNGNQVYFYTQSKVFRYGAELHLHYDLLKSLQAGMIGEYVYSVQLSGEKEGFTLPFSPPASAILNLKYKPKKLGFVEHPYCSVDYRMTAAQTHIVPPEKITEGNTVVNLGLGGDIRIRDQKLNISLQIQNLFDTKYFNHTGFYRLINVPEPGRNFILNISLPFSGKLKQKNH